VTHHRRTILLTLAYDGTEYAGFQAQLNQRTLQTTLEEAIWRITGETLRVVASGRTDSGVHALAQVVGFRTTSKLPAEVFQQALNGSLPPDVVVLASTEAPHDFHPIRDAIGKRYRYMIHDGRVPDVFRRNYLWQYRWPLDAGAMHRAAQCWLGTHDFKSFQTHGSPRVTTIRTIREVTVTRSPPPDENLVTLEVEADGFLYNMVRVMVGTLVEVGRGSRAETWPAEVLASRDRRAAGMTAPPQGLFFVRVDYPPLPPMQMPP
jgi:tRNA pseudouridine38-40 synthase